MTSTMRRDGARRRSRILRQERSGTQYAQRPNLGHSIARRRRRRPEHVHLSVASSANSAGEWMKGGKLTVNGAQAETALAWYIDVMKKSAPTAAANWNWPDIADAFSQGTLASYIDAHSSASVVNNPEKSRSSARLPMRVGPKASSGKRVTSIWNWGFPINSALSEKKKKATWLFIHGQQARKPRPARHIALPALRNTPASTHLGLERR